MLFSLYDRDVIASDWHNFANFNNVLMLIVLASTSMDVQESVTSAILSFNLHCFSLWVLSSSACDGDVISSNWHKVTNVNTVLMLTLIASTMTNVQLWRNCNLVLCSSILLFAGAPFKLCDGNFIASDTKRPQQHWSNVDALSSGRNGNVIKYNDEGVACQQGANIGANKGACDGVTLTNIDGDKF